MLTVPKEGEARAQGLMARLNLEGSPQFNGIFVGTATFEYDVVSVDEIAAICYSVLKELSAAPTRTTIGSWDDEDPDYDSFMKVVANAGGKGRYAQRLALSVVKPPGYNEMP